MHLRVESKLDGLLGDWRAWWNLEPAAAASLEAFRRFLDNMQRNFGASSRCYALVDDARHWNCWLESIVNAIGDYSEVRQQWERALHLE